MEARILQAAELLLNKNLTVREIGKELGFSKSTIHKDLKERLKEINAELHAKVMEVLKNHKEIAPILGGQATRKKYLEEKWGIRHE